MTYDQFRTENLANLLLEVGEQSFEMLTRNVPRNLVDSRGQKPEVIDSRYR